MQSRPERLYRPLPPQKDGEMNQVEKAARFSELHVKGAPLLLYNAWDAGTAKSILDAGAKAIATSSWAVAEAQGYRDGESIPITFVEQIIARIVSTIDAPVSVDFEGGYSDDNGALAENVAASLNSVSSGSISKTASFRLPVSIQSTSTPGVPQPFVKLR